MAIPYYWLQGFPRGQGRLVGRKQFTKQIKLSLYGFNFIMEIINGTRMGYVAMEFGLSGKLKNSLQCRQRSFLEKWFLKAKLYER
jgi:hypothetical protein